MQELSKIGIIAKYTFVETYKSRIFINIIILGLALLLVCYVASELTFGVPGKVVLDFGLGITSLSTVGIAIFLGAGLVSNELENRTVYMVLSRPLRRSSFLLGKVAGMSLILGVNILFLGALTLITFKIVGGDISVLMLWSLLFAFFESLIMLLVVVFLSLIVNIVISVIGALTIFVLGHAVHDAFIMMVDKKWEIAAMVAKTYSIVFPNFFKLNLKDYCIYKQSMPYDYLLKMSSYGVLYSILLIVASAYLFERKNLD